MVFFWIDDIFSLDISFLKGQLRDVEWAFSLMVSLTPVNEVLAVELLHMITIDYYMLKLSN